MPIRTVEGGFRMSTNGLYEYWVPENVKDYLLSRRESGDNALSR